MEGLIKEKLNALAKIAKIDGNFAASEQALLKEIAKSFGQNDIELQTIIDNPEPIGDFKDLSEYHKLEFMFIAIKIMRADELIYDSEIEFCKTLAMNMNIDSKIVDEYATVLEFNFEEFLKKGKKYIL